MIGLKHEYLSVESGGTRSYGGNQTWSGEALLRKSGCGVIAATDLLLYLHRYREKCQAEVFAKAPKCGAIPLVQYNCFTNRLRKKYFPVIPHLGTTGFGIAAGLNFFFRAYRLPLRARWAVWSEEIWAQAAQMLADDLPVICSIGQNIPFFWRKHKVRLYVKTSDNTYQSSSSVKAHYVTITGIDSHWLRVSSWGKEYYINREEFGRYVKKHSSYFVSNIVCVKPKT